MRRPAGDRSGGPAWRRRGAADDVTGGGGGALADVLAAARDALPNNDSADSLFHDEFIDGPRGDGPPRVLALATEVDQDSVGARIAGLEGAEVISTTDLGPAARRPSEVSELGMLAVRLEMAAVYARLGAGVD